MPARSPKLMVAQVDIGTDGADCNPSASAAGWVIGTAPTSELIAAVASQIAGAVCAVPLVGLFLHGSLISLAPDITGDFGGHEVALESLFGLYLLISFALDALITEKWLHLIVDSVLYLLCAKLSCSGTGIALRFSKQ